jgi:hypothetical protein
VHNLRNLESYKETGQPNNVSDPHLRQVSDPHLRQVMCIVLQPF